MTQLSSRASSRRFDKWGHVSILGAAALLGTGITLSPARAVMVDTELELCSSQRTFTEDFNELRVASRVMNDKRWIAHTPWNGDFGDAVFTDPGPRTPFAIKDGILSITASKDETGKWRSGLLASMDGNGRGFAQQYGYFETRAKLPPGPGLWPAFWIGTFQSNEQRRRKEPALEIDVIEHYGHAPAAFSSAFHIWNKTPDRNEQTSHVTDVESGSLYSDFRTYGVKVDERHITYYLDRRPIWQLDTPPEHKSPLQVLINLAMGSGFPIDRTPDPSVMLVDYVHVYALSEPSSANKGCSDG